MILTTRRNSRLHNIAIIALVAGMFLTAGVQAIAEPLFRGSELIPSDAIILFDGKDLSQWVQRDSGEPANWKAENDYLNTGHGDIWTKQKFGDLQLHVEFWLPLIADAKGQGRANSGVFLQGWNYEVQILDSYGLNSGKNDCGAIYNIYPPMVNACRPPQNWQTYDIFFHPAKFDADGKKTANARISVMQNGVWIHENADVPSCTPDPKMTEPKEAAPIVLQDHGSALRFRNIWVRPLAK
jgi:hypothetical protein